MNVDRALVLIANGTAPHWLWQRIGRASLLFARDSLGNNGDEMIHIYVRRNADGCERRVTMKDIPFVAEEWIEGIYHCDCQRQRFFHMANGEPFDAHEHGANKLCGAGKYSVRITDKGHNHLYVDPTFWPQPPEAA